MARTPWSVHVLHFFTNSALRLHRRNLNGHCYRVTGKMAKKKQSNKNHPDHFRTFRLFFACFLPFSHSPRSFSHFLGCLFLTCFWPPVFALFFALFACCHVAAATLIPLAPGCFDLFGCSSPGFSNGFLHTKKLPQSDRHHRATEENISSSPRCSCRTGCTRRGSYSAKGRVSAF